MSSNYFNLLKEFPLDPSFAVDIKGNNSCDFFCDDLNSIEPFQWLLPPPPIPPSLERSNAAIRGEKDTCNFDLLFGAYVSPDSESFIPPNEAKDIYSWFTALIVAATFSVLLVVIFLIFIVKCRRCKTLPHNRNWFSFFSMNNSSKVTTASTASTPSDTCISPVINEKSPQSIISDFPGKKTHTSNKYWQHAVHYRPNALDPSSTQISIGFAENSCTSSPVYAELDANDVHLHRLHQLQSHRINCQNSTPSQSISPYSLPSYSELVDAMRVVSLGSSTALLPEVTYDNAAYLSSIGSDQYHHNRFIRHQRNTPSNNGSTTPLLNSNHSTPVQQSINYTINQRLHRKNRPYSQIKLDYDRNSTLPLGNFKIEHNYEKCSQDYADYEQPIRPMTTFGVQNLPDVQDVPKRPLPPVPGPKM